MKPILHKYQEDVVTFCDDHVHAGLFLDPGLGKTLSILEIIKRKQPRRVLIIAPLRVCYTVWPKEIEKWEYGYSHTLLHGPKKNISVCNNTLIHIINPEGLPWFLAHRCFDDYDILVVDESTKFKNPKAKRVKNLTKMLGMFKNRYILTGTPTPNSLMDLFSQIFILDGGQRFGRSFNKFKMKYFYPVDYQQFYWELKPGAEEEIMGLIEDITIHFSAEDHLDLPEMVENNVLVDLPAKVRPLYKEMENNLFAELESGVSITAVSAAASLNKCRQIANGFVYETLDEVDKLARMVPKAIPLHENKLEAVVDIIEELGGSPVIIGYHFKHDLVMLRKKFPEAPHIGSGVTPDQLVQTEKNWNNGEIPILLGQIQSMSLGLNLQGAGNTIIFFTPTYSQEDYAQFIRRVWRQGQGKRVIVHHILTENTVDESVLQAVQTKSSVQEILLKRLKK